jgi:RsiW-degrading membrane proteinase PrsW (M82 family)
MEINKLNTMIKWFILAVAIAMAYVGYKNSIPFVPVVFFYILAFILGVIFLLLLFTKKFTRGLSGELDD